MKFLHAETTPDVKRPKRASTDKFDDVKQNISFRAEKAGATAPGKIMKFQFLRESLPSEAGARHSTLECTRLRK
jgi:hypothetical protein